jgi:hypothetical protein
LIEFCCFHSLKICSTFLVIFVMCFLSCILILIDFDSCLPFQSSFFVGTFRPFFFREYS